MPRFKSFFGYCLLFISFFCLSQEKKIEYKYYPTTKKSSVKEYQLKKGRKTHEFILDNNKKWSVRLSIPEIKKGEKVPLIIALYWKTK
ncbi:hypothetical protein H9W90_03525 [Polaribacter pectinis]|uniref:Uncharacterized protein n=1 Tax=Polaribacter pectinis TaxID=2738844 RepID=A0A7G9LC54_9FLAO|nr:hypothetical protein [Polaribacter pectinis]QNM86203.1 hypothetical protein H9W90_03525 [Polaribacter pectinis]